MDNIGNAEDGLDPRWFWRIPAVVIHGFFNNFILRKLLLRLRVPLALLIALFIIAHSRREWFACAGMVSVLGEMMQLWCFGVLRKNKELNTHGPYALVRNPMYLSRYFVILGLMLLPGKLWLILVYSSLYYLYMLNRVRREETVLMTLFPETYPHYRDGVRRFIPSVKPYKGHSVWKLNWKLFVKNHGHWNVLGVLVFYLIGYLYLFRSFNSAGKFFFIR